MVNHICCICARLADWHPIDIIHSTRFKLRWLLDQFFIGFYRSDHCHAYSVNCISRNPISSKSRNQSLHVHSALLAFLIHSSTFLLYMSFLSRITTRTFTRLVGQTDDFLSLLIKRIIFISSGLTPTDPFARPHQQPLLEQKQPAHLNW